MSEREVLDLMKTSRSQQEWNANADEVKRNHGGEYPTWWFLLVVRSGLAGEVKRTWQ
jgi:hypothetical protein